MAAAATEATLAAAAGDAEEGMAVLLPLVVGAGVVGVAVAGGGGSRMGTELLKPCTTQSGLAAHGLPL